MMIEPSVYQAIALKGALKLYLDTGMKANRAYTPKNMMRTAAHITGRQFKPRDYAGAISALQCWLDNLKWETAEVCELGVQHPVNQ